MNLSNPEARRGLRSVVMAIVVWVLLAYLWFWVRELDPAALREVVRGVLILIGIALLGYQFENGLRAFKFSVGKDGVKGEATGEDVADAAQETALAAKATADRISQGAQT